MNKFGEYVGKTKFQSWIVIMQKILEMVIKFVGLNGGWVLPGGV